MNVTGHMSHTETIWNENLENNGSSKNSLEINNSTHTIVICRCNLPWYTYPVRLQKMIGLIIQKSMAGNKFKFGPLFEGSLESFTLVRNPSRIHAKCCKTVADGKYRPNNYVTIFLFLFYSSLRCNCVM